MLKAPRTTKTSMLNYGSEQDALLFCVTSSDIISLQDLH